MINVEMIINDFKPFTSFNCRPSKMNLTLSFLDIYSSPSADLWKTTNRKATLRMQGGNMLLQPGLQNQYISKTITFNDLSVQLPNM